MGTTWEWWGGVQAANMTMKIVLMLVILSSLQLGLSSTNSESETQVKNLESNLKVGEGKILNVLKQPLTRFKRSADPLENAKKHGKKDAKKKNTKKKSTKKKRKHRKHNKGRRRRRRRRRRN